MMDMEDAVKTKCKRWLKSTQMYTSCANKVVVLYLYLWFIFYSF